MVDKNNPEVLGVLAETSTNHVSGLNPLSIGRTGEIRTRDQRIKSPLLYRLSYRPIFMEISFARPTLVLLVLDYLLSGWIIV